MDIKDRIQERLNILGLTPRSASLKAGMSADAIRSIFRNPRNSPTTETMEKLAVALETTPEWLAFGVASEVGPQVESGFVEVAGEAGVGIWLERSALQVRRAEFVPVPIMPSRWPHLKQVAHRVIGPSMNARRIEHGDYVVTVDYWGARSEPQNGDIVIVEREQENGLVEVSLKELNLLPDSLELWPRSTDPEYQEPIVLPRAIGPDGFSKIKIIGLVIGRYTPYSPV